MSGEEGSTQRSSTSKDEKPEVLDQRENLIEEGNPLNACYQRSVTAVPEEARQLP